MTWTVQFTGEAIRGLSKLPDKVAVAVVEFATVTLPTNPQRLSKPLQYPFEGLRSARRGDYRVIFTLDHEASIVWIVRVAHRAEAYRPPPPRF